MTRSSIREGFRASPLALALSVAFMPVVRAADEPPRKPSELDKVEVVGKADDYAPKETSTATKTPTPVRDVPQSITIVPQQMIRDQAMQNLGDVVRYVPGVGMAQGEGNRDTPVFRGNGSTADMFVDGMRDDVQYFRDLYNIERVEVLKGPNAMIFGRGGAGGVINRVTRQADWKTIREITAQFGSWDKYRVAADFGQGISDTAAFRVTAMAEDSKSYRDDYQAERWGVNPTFAFAIGEDTTLTLGYEHFEDERVADRGVPSEPGVFNGTRVPFDTDPSTFFGDPARSDATADVDALTALFELQVSDTKLLRNRTRVADYDKFYQNVFPGAVNAARTQVSISAYNNGTQRRNVLNQTDLVWDAMTGNIRHTLLAGVELGHQDTSNLRMTGYFGAAATATSALVPVATPRYTGPLSFRQSATDADNDSVAKNAAVYFQDQIEISDHWQAILGVRYDYFDVDFTNNRQPAGSAARNIQATDNLWSPRAGLVYKPVEPVSLYASYSVAFQPRSGEQLASLSPGNQAFDPEEFTNYEIGGKWDVRPFLSLSLAVYRLDRSNVIAPSPTDPTVSILVDGQRAEGVEVGLAGSITDGWHVMGAFAWQDGEVLAGNDRGKRLAQLPEETFSFWNRWDLGERWGVGLGVQYRDALYSSLSNAVTLKSFTRYDAAFFYDATERLSLQLNVENLFDKAYALSAHNDNNITPGSPRAATLTVRYGF